MTDAVTSGSGVVAFPKAQADDGAPPRRSWLRGLFAPPGGERYAAMEGLRAFAALAIFFVHFAAYFSDLFLKVNLDNIQSAVDLARHERYVTVMYWLFRSHYGVDLFFLLSGFLIFRLMQRPDFRYGTFIANRFRRIFPAYLVCLTAFLVWWGWGRGDGQFGTFDVIGNALLLNSFPQLDVRTLYTVNWSLGYEFAFYFLFPAILVFGNGGAIRRVHILYAAAVTYVAALYLGDGYVRFLMFYGGVLLASYRDEELREMAAAVPDWAVAPVFIGAIVLFHFIHEWRVFTPIFLLASTLLVLNAMFGRSFLNAMFSWGPLRFIGNVSFSLYLVHTIVIDMVFWSYRQTPMDWRRDDWLALFLPLTLVLSIAAAALVYALVERRYFRRKTRVEVRQTAAA